MLRAAGSHLGSLAGADLAARCREGRLDAKGRAVSRTERKRALTAASSSRWAGAITRTSEDAWQLADRNVMAERSALRSRVKAIEARLDVPAGQREGRRRGYATQAERHAKQVRLQVLKARLAAVDQQAEAGAVAVCRGGARLAKARHSLQAAGMTEAGWRERWEAGRWFLTADGEAGKLLGNETIRWHPDEGCLEVKLPAPLGHLANRPHGRYRMSCPVVFGYRGDEVAAQAATGAVRYDIHFDPARGRWYLDASWRAPARPFPGISELRESPVVAADMNAGHLAAWVVSPDGNPVGTPVTIPLVLAGLPASTRDGRVRAAITTLIGIARDHGAQAVAVEDLNFTDARQQGREKNGNRPSRGRQAVPRTRRRHPDREVPGTAGADDIQRRAARHRCGPGLHVPLGGPALARPTAGPAAGHDRASCRRGRDRKARARTKGAATGRCDRLRPEDRRPESYPPSTPDPCAGQGRRSSPGLTAATQWQKTATAERDHPPDQATQDRSGPPT